MQNITSAVTDNVMQYFEGGWADLNPAANWALNVATAVGLILSTYLAAKDDLKVWTTTKAYDTAFKGKSFTDSILAVPQALPAIAYLVLVCHVIASNFVNHANSAIADAARIIVPASLSFFAATSIFEVLVDSICDRSVVRRPSPWNSLPTAAVSESHRCRFYASMILGGVLGTLIGRHPNVYSTTATLVLFNYTLVKQALHWIYIEIASVQALALGSVAIATLSIGAASVLTYAAPDMEIPNASVMVLMFSTVPLVLIFPILSSTLRYESQSSESIFLDEKEDLPSDVPVKAIQLLGGGPSRTIQVSPTTLPTFINAYTHPLALIQSKITFIRFPLFYTLLVIQFLCYLPQMVLLHPVVLKHVVEPASGANGEPDAWCGFFMSIPGAYLASIVVPIAALVAGRVARKDGAEYLKFKDGVFLQ